MHFLALGCSRPFVFLTAVWLQGSGHSSVRCGCQRGRCGWRTGGRRNCSRRARERRLQSTETTSRKSVQITVTRNSARNSKHRFQLCESRGTVPARRGVVRCAA
eukprot:401279-Rhodomonas_salina.1